MKPVYIVTLGCKLNQFESEALAENLRGAGFDIARSMEESGTVVVNTCTVTNQADARSRQVLRKARRMGKFAVATGCYATSDYDTLARSDFADMVVDNANKFRLAEYLGAEHAVPGTGDFPQITSFERTRAYIKIQDGCDKFCSYCKIPFARGRSRSLDPASIRTAARNLITGGYKEIVLTGVNISDYHYQNETLASLTGQLLEIPGDYRIRLSSIQPDEFEPRLIDYLGRPSFAGHFHISLQSGSDSVLKRMNRHYTSRDFLKTVESIHKKLPECGITTDIIVGFPGETDTEFEETAAIVKQARFTRVHIFPYSPRKGTRAAVLKDIHGDLKTAREKILRETYLDTAKKFIHEQVIGKPQKVLVETIKKGIANGYTSNYLRAVFPYNGETNRFIELIPENLSVAGDWSIDLEGKAENDNPVMK